MKLGSLILFLLGTIALAESQTLDEIIYKSYTGNPCVWLVNNEGGVGCHTPRSGVVGITHYVETSEELTKFLTDEKQEPRVLVMPVTLLAHKGLVAAMEANKTESTRVLGAIILDSDTLPTESFSPDLKNPGSSATSKGNFFWNPSANGLLYKKISFPLWHLNKKDSEDVRNRTLINKNRTEYPYNAAEITAFMHPQTVENTDLCIKRNTCKPLGGHSTYTPIAPLTNDSKKEIIFAIAGMDSAGLFQLKTVGANGDMSGTVAMMAALDALLKTGLTPPTKWTRNIVFAWLDGESWGNLGSREFISDIRSFKCEETAGDAPYDRCASPSMPSLQFKNIQLDKIHSIIEAKQVGAKGKALFKKNLTNLGDELFVHQQTKDFTVPAANLALKIGEAMTDVRINAAADPRTPSVPPGALTGIFKEEPSLAAKSILVADHEAEYKNKFYHSIFDTATNVDSKLVCKAATLIARTLSVLARGLKEPDTEAKSINADCTLVETLLDCTTKNNTCALARKFLPGLDEENGGDWPVHYPSVYSSSSISLYQKFVHDWVYDRIGKKDGTNCTTSEDCKGNQTCVASECQEAVVFYHPARNPNIRRGWSDWSGGYWEVLNTSSDDVMWAESDWTPIGLRLFNISDPQVDYVMSGIAAGELVVTIIICFLVNKYFHQKVKIL